mgnify:CR=1 FL=1
MWARGLVCSMALGDGFEPGMWRGYLVRVMQVVIVELDKNGDVMPVW